MKKGRDKIKTSTLKKSKKGLKIVPDFRNMNSHWRNRRIVRIEILNAKKKDYWYAKEIGNKFDAYLEKRKGSKKYQWCIIQFDKGKNHYARTIRIVDKDSAKVIRTLKKKKRKEYTRPTCLVATTTLKSKGLPDNHEYLVKLRTFRDNYVKGLEGGHDFIKNYYAIAPKIISGIEAMNEKEKKDTYDTLFWILKSTIKKIDEGYHEFALGMCKDIINILKKEFNLN